MLVDTGLVADAGRAEDAGLEHHLISNASVQIYAVFVALPAPRGFDRERLNPCLGQPSRTHVFCTIVRQLKVGEPNQSYPDIAARVSNFALVIAKNRPFSSRPPPGSVSETDGAMSARSRERSTKDAGRGTPVAQLAAT